MAEHQQLQTRVPSVMEDPGAKAVARVYADAFLQAAGDRAGELLEEFTSLHDDVLAKQPEFARLLAGRSLGRDEKVRLIERTIAPQASDLFANFLRVLARHERLDLLPAILHEAHVRRERALGRRRVIVTTAVPLSDEEQARTYERLKAALPFDPVLIPKVDPKVLGGLVIQVGDTVYDASLRARLNQLRSRLRQRSLYEIQSGRDRFGHST
ncbi:MAG TPA: ATP synthase F1 subunit delta [Planctomycetaceae bacterium]